MSSTSMSTQVRLATADELNAIGHFRYVALLGDTGFRPSEEMRATERLIDAWDPLSDVLIAGDGSDIQATFRVVPLARVAEAHGLSTVLRAFDHLGLWRALQVFALHEINVVGRLAVAPSLRGTRTVVDVLGTAMHMMRTRGERLTLADCSPPLVRLYERLAGFFRAGTDYRDPIYGIKTPIMGTIGDHQASVRAAIGHVARAFPDDATARAFRMRVMVPAPAESANEEVRSAS